MLAAQQGRSRQISLVSNAACTCPFELQTRHALRTNQQVITTNSQGGTPLIIRNELIAELVVGEYSCREAASMADAFGKLPLHISANSGRKVDVGMNTILRSKPRALQARDVTTMVYPFILSALFVLWRFRYSFQNFARGPVAVLLHSYFTFKMIKCGSHFCNSFATMS